MRLQDLPNPLLLDIFRCVCHDTCVLYTDDEAHDACTAIAKAARCEPPPGAWLFTCTNPRRPKHYVQRHYLLKDKDMRRVKRRRDGTYDDRQCRAIAFSKFNKSAVEFGAARVARVACVEPALALSLCSEAYLSHVARLQELSDEPTDEAERLDAVARELERHRLRPEPHASLRDYVRGGSLARSSIEDAVDAFAEPLVGRSWWRARLDAFLVARPDGLPINLVDALAKATRSPGCHVCPGAHFRVLAFAGRPWLRRASLREAIDHVLLDGAFDADRLDTETADAMSELRVRYGGIELADIQEHAWTEWLLGEYRTAVVRASSVRAALAPFIERGMDSVWYDDGVVKGVSRGGLHLSDLPWRSWYYAWMDDCVVYKDYVSMAEEADGVLRRWAEVVKAMHTSNFGSTEHKQYILMGHPGGLQPSAPIH